MIVHQSQHECVGRLLLAKARKSYRTENAKRDPYGPTARNTLFGRLMGAPLVIKDRELDALIGAAQYDVLVMMQKHQYQHIGDFWRRNTFLPINEERAIEDQKAWDWARVQMREENLSPDTVDKSAAELAGRINDLSAFAHLTSMKAEP